MYNLPVGCFAISKIISIGIGGIALFSMTSSTVARKSTFRYGKHNFAFSSGADNSKGLLLASLLNTYNLMPANVTGKYAFTDESCYYAAKSDLHSIDSLPSGFIEFWNNKADALWAQPLFAGRKAEGA